MQKMQNAKISQKMQVHFTCKEVPQKCRIMQMHESGHSTPGYFELQTDPVVGPTSSQSCKPQYDLLYVSAIIRRSGIQLKGN